MPKGPVRYGALAPGAGFCQASDLNANRFTGFLPAGSYERIPLEINAFSFRGLATKRGTVNEALRVLT